jgi:hypothetical protein
MRDARSHRAQVHLATGIAVRRAAVDVAAARNIAPRRTTVAKNVKQEVKDGGKTLVITIDLTQDFGLSSSGKSVIIASTEGNVSVPGNETIKVGLNIFKKA